MINNSIWIDIKNHLSSIDFESLLYGALYFGVGFIAIKLIAFLMKKATDKYINRQSSMIVNKIINYGGITFLVILILSSLGVNLAALLGAAGLLGLIFGVASQKSIGNMVSGFFLLSEKPFEIGDVVKVAGQTGIVMDIELLALKIRTFDNQLVRIPNEVIITSELTNVTRFPIRRMDFKFSVTYGDDLDRLEELLMDLARKNPHVLNDPLPLFILTEYGDHGIGVLFGVWFMKNDYMLVKNPLFKEILSGLNSQGMSIPFQQMVVHEAEKEAP